MESHLVLDDDLIRRLPLPLAQLYRRAHNAKTPLECHLTAFYLWEASLKLLSSSAIVAYAEQPIHDPELTERLQCLARPALGHWWEFSRRLLPVLPEPGFQKVRDLLLGKARDDFPRGAGLDAMLLEALDGKEGKRATVRFSDLFDRMIRFRNGELGHGAAGQRPSAFYQRSGVALLTGMAELLRRVDILAARKLVHVADVRRLTSGNWLVEWYDLHGEAPRRLPSLEVADAQASSLPHPDQLYLYDPEATGRLWRSLHPLIVYEPELARVSFLNARRGKLQAEYLCYTTGEVTRRDALDNEQRALLARVLGTPVDDAAVKEWAERTQAEEPGLEQESESNRRTIAEFELLSRIGQGGMGVVYRAWQPSLGRQVALKCLLRQGDEKAERRFNREIKALGRVEHPHLVKVFTSGTDGDQWFYAMELVEGADLACVCARLAGSTASEVSDEQWTKAVTTACQYQRLQEKRLSQDQSKEYVSSIKVLQAPAVPTPLGGRGYVARVVELVRQVCGAAHALHEAGVIHRDIKPGNVMLTTDGRYAVLMDLGLAQLSDDTEGRLTRTRQFVGTLRYASPEQVLAAGDLDRRTDVYSLGATLWELLTLRPLFSADDQMPPPELMLRIQSMEPERVRKYNPHVPPDLQAIVRRCLEKERSRRYATAADLAQDLARWQRGEAVLAQPPSLHYLLRKQMRRYRVPITIAAAILSLLVATGISYFVRMAVALNNANRAHNYAGDELDQITSKVMETWLVSQKSLSDTQTQKLLQQALEGYTSLTKFFGNDEQTRARTANANLRIGQIQQLLKQVPSAEDAFRTSQDQYERLVSDYPKEPKYREQLAESHRLLGLLLASEPGKSADAQVEYQTALQIQQQLINDYPDTGAYQSDLAQTHNNLGNLFEVAHEYPSAQQEYQAALTLRQLLAKAEPTNAGYQSDLATTQSNLGVLSFEIGNVTEGKNHYTQALAIRTQLGDSNPKQQTYQESLAESHHNLGQLLLKSKDYLDAENEFHAAAVIFMELSASFPLVPDYQKEAANSDSALAVAYLADKKPQNATEQFQAAVKIWRSLADNYPNRPEYQQALGRTYRIWADRLKSSNPKDAETEYLAALKVQTALAGSNSSNATYQADAADTHYALGNLYYYRLKNFSQAASEYQAAINTEQPLLTQSPASASYREALGLMHHNYANLLVTMKNPTQATAEYEAALALWQPLVTDVPKKASYQNDLGTTLVGLASLLTAPKDWPTRRQLLEQARSAYQAALQVQPTDAVFRARYRTDLRLLADTLLLVGDYADAAGSANDLAKLGVRPASDDYDAAGFLVRCSALATKDPKGQPLADQYAQQAVALLSQAVAHGYSNANQLSKDPKLSVLQARADFQKLVGGLKTTPVRSQSLKPPSLAQTPKPTK